MLSLIADTEISRVTDADMKLVEDCVNRSLAIQNKKVELSKEFIEEQIKKFFSGKRRRGFRAVIVLNPLYSYSVISFSVVSSTGSS